jgi:hypothetical protein
MGKIAESWKYHNNRSKVVLVFIILYCIGSIFVLGLAYGLLPLIPDAHLNPDILVAYSIISFGVALFISAYHLNTLLKRRKRRCDRIPDIERLCGGRRIYPDNINYTQHTSKE